MTERPVELWLFYPENDPLVARQAIQMIGNECSRRRWAFEHRPTHLITPAGRPIGRVRPEDAIYLYKQIHRARVGVWQIENAHVQKQPQPRRTPIDYFTLRRFVLHKAYHRTLPSMSWEVDWGASLDEFLVWMNGTHCEGEGDPRCLPFHVFDTNFDLDRLGCRHGRGSFAEKHGAQSRRSDGKGLTWTRPGGAHHGYDTLQVAGRELIRGFHWDVEGNVNQRIVTTLQSWRLKRNAYVNVYPDGHIRTNDKRARRANA